MMRSKYIRAALHEDRYDLLDKVARWLAHEPKADIKQVKKLYGLTEFEVRYVTEKSKNSAQR
jgi:hypothetical protein